MCKDFEWKKLIDFEDEVMRITWVPMRGIGRRRRGARITIQVFQYGAT